MGRAFFMPTLTILHTANLQARFDQMTRLGTLIQRERAAANAEQRQVLLLDAGGSSTKDIWQSDVTQGRANYLLLEALGYDATLLSEADWQWGAANLKRLVEAVYFPVLAANLHQADTQTLPEGVRGYVIFRFEGISVGVVGLTQGTAGPELTLADATETLTQTLPELQKENIQVVLVLSQLGIEANRQLAQTVPGLHLILGAGTAEAQAEQVGSTLIATPADLGTTLGRIAITFTEDGTIQALTANPIPCPPTTPPDPTAAGMLDLIEFEAGVARKKVK